MGLVLTAPELPFVTVLRSSHAAHGLVRMEAHQVTLICQAQLQPKSFRSRSIWSWQRSPGSPRSVRLFVRATSRILTANLFHLRSISRHFCVPFALKLVHTFKAKIQVVKNPPSVGMRKQIELIDPTVY